MIVLASVRAESFRKPGVLPPRFPPHVLTELITVVDTEGGNAVSLVEPRTSLHYLHLFFGFLQHLLDGGKLELLVHQLRQPFAA